MSPGFLDSRAPFVIDQMLTCISESRRTPAYEDVLVAANAALARKGRRSKRLNIYLKQSCLLVCRTLTGTDLSAMLLLLICILLSTVHAFPAYSRTSGTSEEPVYTPFPNVTALLNMQTSHMSSLERRQITGTGICATAMSGFRCNMDNHEQNRCAGDAYSYCICAGGANGAGVDGLWL